MIPTTGQTRERTTGQKTGRTEPSVYYYLLVEVQQVSLMLVYGMKLNRFGTSLQPDRPMAKNDRPNRSCFSLTEYTGK
jgi:hypothetical protein